MNAIQPHTSNGWSRQRWIATIFLVFIGQIGLILLVGESPRATSNTEAPFKLSLTTISPETADPAFGDPTLFALAHPRGFSGHAWLHAIPQNHSFWEWREDQPWLGLQSDALARDVAGFTTNSPPQSVVQKPLPESTLIIHEDLRLLLPERSYLTVAGELSGKDLLAAPALPVIPHGGALAPSVVQSLIASSGATFSSILVAESGSPAADQAALDAARTMRFSRADAAAVTSSNSQYRMALLTFHWLTAPASPTDASAPAR